MTIHDQTFPVETKGAIGWRDALWVASFALIYFLVARLSLLLVFEPEGIAVIWPPAGIFLSAILLTRKEIRPYLIGTLFLTDLAAELLVGTSPLVGLVYSAALTGDAAFSAWLLHRFVGESITFQRVRDLTGFLLFSVLLSNALAATVAASVAGYYSWTSFSSSWFGWWSADGVGTLLVTPLIMNLAYQTKLRFKNIRTRRVIEGAVMFLLILLLNNFTFAHSITDRHVELLFVLVSFPILIWAALRLGVIGTISAILTLALVILMHTMSGHFVYLSAGSNLVLASYLQIYLAIAFAPALFLAVVIAEHTQDKKEIEESERRYRDFFEDDLTGDYISRPDGTIIECNPAFAKIFEYDSVDDVMRHNASEFHPTSDVRSKFLELLKKEKRLINVETEGLTQTGRIIHLIENIIGKFDENGELVEIKGYLFDDTERKHASELLKARERRFGALIENISDVITILGAEGLMKFESPSVQRILGYGQNELIGRSAFEFIHPEDHTKVAEAIAAGLGEAFAVVETDYRFRHKNGTWRHLHGIGVNMIHDETLQGFVVTSRDITENKSYEKDLVEARDQAERSEKLKDAFIANISHEIRTPLNIILGYNGLIETMLEQKAHADEMELFENVKEGSVRLMRTVDMILDISRLQVGDIKLHPAPLDLCSLVEASVQEHEVIAQQKSLVLSVMLADEAVVAEADEYTLRQTLDNLIGNALKYTREGGVVLVVRYAASGAPCIDVKDTGIGIDPDYLPRLFSPYSQEQIGMTRAYDGVGLGLALVKNYTAMNGITIHVESEKGVGTTFTLEFRIPDGASEHNMPSGYL
ncbi:MAG: PAS domain S-box protein [Bacteroidota bacterium]